VGALEGLNVLEAALRIADGVELRAAEPVNKNETVGL
jgi:hypothetical protein